MIDEDNEWNNNENYIMSNDNNMQDTIDFSWKIRKTSLDLLLILISTGNCNDQHQITTLLIHRLKERDHNVKQVILNTIYQIVNNPNNPNYDEKIYQNLYIKCMNLLHLQQIEFNDILLQILTCLNHLKIDYNHEFIDQFLNLKHLSISKFYYNCLNSYILYLDAGYESQPKNQQQNLYPKIMNILHQVINKIEIIPCINSLINCLKDKELIQMFNNLLFHPLLLNYKDIIIEQDQILTLSTITSYIIQHNQLITTKDYNQLIWPIYITKLKHITIVKQLINIINTCEHIDLKILLKATYLTSIFQILSSIDNIDVSISLMTLLYHLYKKYPSSIHSSMLNKIPSLYVNMLLQSNSNMLNIIIKSLTLLILNRPTKTFLSHINQLQSDIFKIIFTNKKILSYEIDQQSHVLCYPINYQGIDQINQPIQVIQYYLITCIQSSSSSFEYLNYDYIYQYIINIISSSSSLDNMDLISLHNLSICLACISPYNPQNFNQQALSPVMKRKSRKVSGSSSPLQMIQHYDDCCQLYITKLTDNPNISIIISSLYTLAELVYYQMYKQYIIQHITMKFLTKFIHHANKDIQQAAIYLLAKVYANHILILSSIDSQQALLKQLHTSTTASIILKVLYHMLSITITKATIKQLYINFVDQLIHEIIISNNQYNISNDTNIEYMIAKCYSQLIIMNNDDDDTTQLIKLVIKPYIANQNYKSLQLISILSLRFSLESLYKQTSDDLNQQLKLFITKEIFQSIAEYHLLAMITTYDDTLIRLQDETLLTIYQCCLLGSATTFINNALIQHLYQLIKINKTLIQTIDYASFKIDKDYGISLRKNSYKILYYILEHHIELLDIEQYFKMIQHGFIDQYSNDIQMMTYDFFIHVQYQSYVTTFKHFLNQLPTYILSHIKMLIKQTKDSKKSLSALNILQKLIQMMYHFKISISSISTCTNFLHFYKQLCATNVLKPFIQNQQLQYNKK